MKEGVQSEEAYNQAKGRKRTYSLAIGESAGLLAGTFLINKIAGIGPTTMDGFFVAMEVLGVGITVNHSNPDLDRYPEISRVKSFFVKR